MAVELQPPKQRWECPSCGEQRATRDARPHTPMHHCPTLAGLAVPFVAAGRNGLARGAARHVVEERQDYEAGEHGLARIDGRPVMAVRTERADGSNDATVYAPCATARLGVATPEL